MPEPAAPEKRGSATMPHPTPAAPEKRRGGPEVRPVVPVMDRH